MPVATGSRVRIAGLRNKGHFNGREGWVVDVRARLVVELDEHTTLYVRHENVVCVSKKRRTGGAYDGYLESLAAACASLRIWPSRAQAVAALSSDKDDQIVRCWKIIADMGWSVKKLEVSSATFREDASYILVGVENNLWAKRCDDGELWQRPKYPKHAPDAPAKNWQDWQCAVAVIGGRLHGIHAPNEPLSSLWLGSDNVPDSFRGYMRHIDSVYLVRAPDPAPVPPPPRSLEGADDGVRAPPPPASEALGWGPPCLELFHKKKLPGGGHPVLHIFDPKKDLDYNALSNAAHTMWIANVPDTLLYNADSLNRNNVALCCGYAGAYPQHRRNAFKFFRIGKDMKPIDKMRTSEGGTGFLDFRMQT